MGAVLAFASVGLTAFGTYMQMKAAQAQGVAAQNQANFEATISQRNAMIARQNAELTRERGDSEIQNISMQTGLTIGRQRAGASAAGVDMESGSVLDVLSSTRLIGQQDIDRMRYNIEMEARGHQTEAGNFESSAAMSRLSGAYARGAAQGNQFTTLLTGGASIMQTGYNTGLFPKFGK